MRLDVTIPANTRAEVILPGAKAGLVTESSVPVNNSIQVGKDTKVETGSGTYRFEYPLD